jgi:UDP-N-acetyl-alpha-D-muramoyl-L-alanyl-L-glutamate epimerase
MTRLDNFSKFRDFREKYDFFSYENYSWQIKENILSLEFSFNLSGKYIFSPSVSIPYKPSIYRPVDTLSPAVLDSLVFHCGLIEMISYWKAACPGKVLIKAGKLNQPQVEFWKKIYFQGLGEFFYLNSIETSREDFMEILADDINSDLIRPGLLEGALVPVGGGKDSAVSLELLRKSGLEVIPMAVNPRKATVEVIKASGSSMDRSAEILREIDPLLLKLNKEGYLNGHTPFSALLAFYSLLSAYLTGRKDIILSNESSASESTVPGTGINHQYSKSYEFEKDFRNYTQEYISPEFNYFSLLRPISELQIAGLFSGMDRYHQHFRSCNAGSKTDSWCGKCAKCLFTFIILSPFLDPVKLKAIFGMNILDDGRLSGVLEELTGISHIKPFECIGTVDEVKLALDKTLLKYDQGSVPALLKHYQMHKRAVPSGAIDFERIMKTLGDEHFVPEKYLNILTQALHE